MPFRLFYLLVLLLSACGNNEKIPQPGKQDTPIYYAYSPVLSNELDAGNPAYAKNVLQVWRLFETGNLTTSVDLFADSITLILPDSVMKGKRDAVLLRYQNLRNKYSDLQCYVWRWMPVKPQREEELVFVWGLHDGTRRNGDRDYTQIHQIWYFNTQGKIRKLEQYRTHPF